MLQYNIRATINQIIFADKIFFRPDRQKFYPNNLEYVYLPSLERRRMVAKRKIIYHIHTRASERFTFAVRRTLQIVAALIVDFSSFALNEFLFFLPCFFENFNKFRPDFRISHFIPGRIYIDKPSHVTSRYTKNIFFRDTA